MWGDISLWFWFAFLWWLVMLSIVSCACWPSVCLLWKKCLFRTSAHFLIGLFAFLMMSCMSCLYNLDINPLSIILFANLFSHLVGYFFILLMVFFVVQKFLSSVRYHLFIFAFISFALGDRSKKNIAMIYAKKCPTYVFS